MTNTDLANYLRCDLFADRETVKGARDYAFEVISRLAPDDRLMAYTAMMVLTNTIAKQIERNEASQ